MAKERNERDQSDIAFTHIVASVVRKAGYQIPGAIRSPWFAVAITDDDHIGLVCTRLSGTIAPEMVNVFRNLGSRSPRVLKVALVRPEAGGKQDRNRIEKSFGVDVVPFSDIKGYLDEWKEIITDDLSGPRVPPGPPSKPSPRRTTPATRIKANADAIITIVRSLALQIDTKLEALRTNRPNSDDGMAGRAAAISEYEELRRRVAELEKAVARLKQPHAKTTEVVKAGKKFGDSVEKWWSKSGGKVLDKSADMGIVMSSVGVLALMGVNPAIAAGIAAAVVTGKSMAGVFKSAAGL